MAMRVRVGYQIISEFDGITTVAIFVGGSLCYIGAGSTREVRGRLGEWFNGRA